MKIKFEITTAPEKEQMKYVTAYLEGVLNIFIENKLFFKQPGILLIEFAIFIKRWLSAIKEKKVIDFLYETMDYDGPILKIAHIKDGLFIISSIWQEMEVKEPLLQEDVVAAFNIYLDNLAGALKLQLGIELNDIIDASQDR